MNELFNFDLFHRKKVKDSFIREDGYGNYEVVVLDGRVEKVITFTKDKAIAEHLCGLAKEK